MRVLHCRKSDRRTKKRASESETGRESRREARELVENWTTWRKGRYLDS